MEHARARLRLLVGLGNPGRQYASTRHNAGFWWIERVAAERGASLLQESKFQGLVGKLGADCWALMPQTYMNRSGYSVAGLARFYRIVPEQILVVHDELDLKPGDVRLKLGGGNAGHNGLRDVAAQLGSGNFWRLRIGIGHPRSDPQSQVDVADYVLHRPSADDRRLIDDAIARSAALWPVLADGDVERAMHLLHSKPQPAKPAAEKPTTHDGPEGSEGA